MILNLESLSKNGFEYAIMTKHGTLFCWYIIINKENSSLVIKVPKRNTEEIKFNSYSCPMDEIVKLLYYPDCVFVPVCEIIFSPRTLVSIYEMISNFTGLIVRI